MGTLVATVDARNVLLGLGDPGVLLGAEVGDTSQGARAATTVDSSSVLLAVLDNQLTTRGLHNLGLVGLGGIGMPAAEDDTLDLWKKEGEEERERERGKGGRRER